MSALARSSRLHAHPERRLKRPRRHCDGRVRMDQELPKRVAGRKLCRGQIHRVRDGSLTLSPSNGSAASRHLPSRLTGLRPAGTTTGRAGRSPARRASAVGRVCRDGHRSPWLPRLAALISLSRAGGRRPNGVTPVFPVLWIQDSRRPRPLPLRCGRDCGRPSRRTVRVRRRAGNGGGRPGSVRMAVPRHAPGVRG
jgi:hypothetical protein